MKYYDRLEDSPLSERPDFNDIMDNTEVGVFKRGLTRYLFSRNPERTEKTHKIFGASIVRTAIMSTYGRLLPRYPYSNYRTDRDKTRVEGSTRFAVGGSVVNEGLHTGAALHQSYELLQDFAAGQSFSVHAVAFGINTAFVSLQRYNRARMVQRVNEEFQNGNGFDYSYTNWLGLDSVAMHNYLGSIRQKEAIDFGNLHPNIASGK